MSYSCYSKPEVAALSRELSNVVDDWDKFAVQLPGVTTTHLSSARVDCPGNLGTTEAVRVSEMEGYLSSGYLEQCRGCLKRCTAYNWSRWPGEEVDTSIMWQHHTVRYWHIGCCLSLKTCAVGAAVSTVSNGRTQDTAGTKHHWCHVLGLVHDMTQGCNRRNGG